MPRRTSRTHWQTRPCRRGGTHPSTSVSPRSTNALRPSTSVSGRPRGSLRAACDCRRIGTSRKQPLHGLATRCTADPDRFQEARSAGASAQRFCSAAGRARLDHHGGGILRRDAGGCFGTSRQARYLQHGPGQSVHRLGLHRRARRQWHYDQHGRQGAWRDNVFVERLWRSVKYEEVYLRAYDSVCEARASIGRYLDFYNARRPHSSLDGTTPDQAYFPPLPLRLAA